MSLEILNDPNNKLSQLMNCLIKGFQDILLDPFFQVI